MKTINNILFQTINNKLRKFERENYHIESVITKVDESGQRLHITITGYPQDICKILYTTVATNPMSRENNQIISTFYAKSVFGDYEEDYDDYFTEWDIDKYIIMIEQNLKRA